MDHNLGSPISTLTPHEGTINYGPPIPMRDNGSISGSSNSNSPLDNSNRAIRGTKLSTLGSRLKLYYFNSLKVN